MLFKRIVTSVGITSFAWLLVVVSFGVVVSAESLNAWLLLSVIALGPGAMLIYLAKTLPGPTSQRVQEARR